MSRVWPVLFEQASPGHGRVYAVRSPLPLLRFDLILLRDPYRFPD